MDIFSDLPAPGNTNRAEVHSVEPDKTDVKVSTNDAVDKEKQETASLCQAEFGQQGRDEEKVSLKRKSIDEQGDQVSVKRLASGVCNLRGYFAERKGERNEMQDKHVILDDFTQQFSILPSTVSRLSFYAVYDGHSGDKASAHAAKTLHKHIISKFPKTEMMNQDKEIKKCLIDAFRVTDEEFLKQASASKPVWKDGSTAVCVLVVNDTLYIANLGDSKAFLCRYNPETEKHQFLPLSKDHTPTQYEERMRIQKAGGTVRNGRVMGIMEVSRSIGDGRFKHCGVISTPDIKKCQLGDNDRYILLSCDGLWEGFDADTVMQFTNQMLDGENAKQSEGKSKDDVLFETACNRLASEAIRRGSSDNITVILVNVKKS
ncbi:integrin-linked kinase-associated serine/threonine phosphatase 2C-like isoform X2 [Lytechinus variegatus]|uniref:integrin-linked kinase-associated serine/threonine phosphatase 2C-like isoform X2 n=1 Tax=Lytechinus variegatus TaxID=7654 RepID=UPI001BB19BA3|nr:integrin-linked kinase-associated serine/threonine phosphatase 2C-like isoform X2 [Lytechinus variegatus]